MPPSPDPSYRVVARRFRPRAFDEVVGQEAVLASLRAALAAGRVPHALLFSGSRGVGKTTLARIVARALNCERGVGADPCGACHACQATLEGSNPDVIEIDAASHNLVDDIRELRDRVGFASMGSRYKVYILDEVHMLTRNAFNAFLKTLEEPPANVVFILATTELHKVPETIRSRCQVHLFRRIGDADIVERLAAICAHEGVEIDAEVLREIAASSRGGMRDAETALERVLPVAQDSGARFDLDGYRRIVQRVGTDRVAELVGGLAAGDAAAGLQFAAAVAEAGVDEREALGEVVEMLRGVLLLAVDGPESGLVQYSGAVRDGLVELAGSLERDRVDAMIQAGLDGRERLRRLDDRRLVLEIALLRMAEAGTVPTLAELVEQVQAGTLAAPAPAVARPAVAPEGRALKTALAAAVAERKPMLESTVQACDVAGPDADGTVVLKLASTRKMHADRLASPELQSMLTELLTEIVGRRVTVRTERAGGAAAPRAHADAATPSRAVERIKDKFDGTYQQPE